MENKFDVLKQIIETRRTVKTMAMNGQTIPHEDMMDILKMADWAPTHGRTEPWRFIVLTGENLAKFGEHHAELYAANTPAEERTETKYNSLKNMGNNASHLVIAVMRRTPNAKIIIEEEYMAASAAIQNMLLSATAKGIASFWNTGGMTHHEVMKMYLELQPEDQVMGLLYFGYTDQEPKEGVRKIALEDKIIWI